MKIIFNITELLYNKIKMLINDGKYSSLSSFTEIAFQNQLTLEQELNNEVIELKDLSKLKAKNKKHKVNLKKIFSENNVLSYNFNRVKFPTQYLNNLYEMLKFELIDLSGVGDPSKIWIWGQINKIFPVKFLLRLLISMNSDNSSPIPLVDFQKYACLQARNLGLMLLNIDEKAGNRRDESLSIAFPIGGDSEKAKARFKGQYIANVRTDGKFSGALLEMRFAGIKMINNEKILKGPTETGLEFAKLKSPVLDDNNYEKTMSEEESKYYIFHCREYLPGEYNLISLIAESLLNGEDTREQLNEKLHNIALANWSSAAVNTQRSGVVSRMFELGLIYKIRIRNTVRYKLTDLGKELINLS